jgi:hypothetical protein
VSIYQLLYTQSTDCRSCLAKDLSQPQLAECVEHVVVQRLLKDGGLANHSGPFARCVLVGGGDGSVQLFLLSAPTAA